MKRVSAVRSMASPTQPSAIRKNCDKVWQQGSSLLGRKKIQASKHEDEAVQNTIKRQRHAKIASFFH